MPNEPIRYVECPRDAWQGLPRILPTEVKRDALAGLIDAGFRWLDAGSFVSPRAVPQMADSEQVLGPLDAPPGVDVLGIVGNLRGAERAAATPGVTSIGYPLSVDDTFQRRNLGRTVEEGWADVVALRDRCREADLGLVVYLSMGFGNPYGNPWVPDDTARAVARLRALGIAQIAVADTAGTADAETVALVLRACADPDLGLHLHAHPAAWRSVVDAGIDAGIRWFEGALAGVGGCPFAGDALVGNLPTERVIPYLHDAGFETGVDLGALPVLAERAASLAATYGS